ncbi:pyruvate kinase [Butyrivibrio proteoclasticus]|uniref:pyruvate kinase n=1 Tax=Butyrivibrio proteoclasticus TaxID=43305 RepID=UPI00047B66DA|nr:pyruvate kinase [Butyrivibrio proteoclasticus]
MRKTKIICTIGPASESEEKLREIMLAGMNVARFNFSHGSHEEHKRKYDRIKKLRDEMDLPIAVMLDTKGPEIRLKDFEGGKTELVTGQRFTLTSRDIMGSNSEVSITYKELTNDCKPGMTILLDDGLIELKVDTVTDTDITCTVVNGGPISDKKGVNVPGAKLTMPYLSEQDRGDIIFGCEQGFDFVAASFVRTKDDVLAIREILKDKNSQMKIIAKIESTQGIDNLKEILEVADGIMVARGDMGVEVPFEEVPVIQKEMIKMAEASGKYVITATQMLDSMIHHPRPTRAEVTDVANAIYDGTTAIMLSGETASGDYPVEAVRTMAKIAERTEADIDYVGRLKKRDYAPTDSTTAISHATCNIAAEVNADAILTVTMSGFTASMVSMYKPNCQIIACTINPTVCRQANLMWGVAPLHIRQEDTADELFREAINSAKNAGYLKKGDKVVLTAGVPLGIPGRTNMIRVEEL